MLCPSCQAENRGGRRFCSKCGASLAVVCGACSFANEPDDEFCGGCGARLRALHLLGDIATHPDRFDAEHGEDHYLKALTLAEPRGMRPLIAHCHLGLGKFYRGTGKREQVQEHLTTAVRMYREMDMRFWLEQAEAGRDT